MSNFSDYLNKALDSLDKGVDKIDKFLHLDALEQRIVHALSNEIGQSQGTVKAESTSVESWSTNATVSQETSPQYPHLPSYPQTHSTYQPQQHIQPQQPQYIQPQPTNNLNSQHLAANTSDRFAREHHGGAAAIELIETTPVSKAPFGEEVVSASQFLKPAFVRRTSDLGIGRQQAP